VSTTEEGSQVLLVYSDLRIPTPDRSMLTSFEHGGGVGSGGAAAGPMRTPKRRM